MLILLGLHDSLHLKAYGIEKLETRVLLSRKPWNHVLVFFKRTVSFYEFGKEWNTGSFLGGFRELRKGLRYPLEEEVRLISSEVVLELRVSRHVAQELLL